jgi:histidinol-phosphate aminotransferase
VEPFDEPALEAEPGRRPSPRVRAALRKTAETLHRYPRGADGLAERLARLHGVSADCIALSGGGATELLERCLRAFCRPGDEVVSPFPTFEVLSALCSRERLRHRPAPGRRGPDGLFPPRHEAALLLAAAGPRSRLVYVATPDNPTGAVLPAEEREKLEAAPIPLVLDEAWSLELPQPMRPRAIHLRSLSKLHGLAALRIGYAIGPAEKVRVLRKLELPFPLGAPQLAAAHAVLDEPERARRAALLIQRERNRVAQVFRAMDCAVSESVAPVLLVRHPRQAGRLLFALQGAGLPVQESHWDPATFILALGRRGQNDRAIQAARRAVAPMIPGD